MLSFKKFLLETPTMNDISDNNSMFDAIGHLLKNKGRDKKVSRIHKKLIGTSPDGTKFYHHKVMIKMSSGEVPLNDTYVTGELGGKHVFRFHGKREGTLLHEMDVGKDMSNNTVHLPDVYHQILTKMKGIEGIVGYNHSVGAKNAWNTMAGDNRFKISEIHLDDPDKETPITDLTGSYKKGSSLILRLNK